MYPSNRQPPCKDPSPSKREAYYYSHYNLQNLGEGCVTAKLVHLLPHLLPSLFGSVPGQSSIDLAFELQAAIEESLYSDQPLVGVSMDLSKAYNTLSRPILRGIVLRLGCPPPLWQAYSNFLQSLDRFFKIDHSVFGPCSSKIGVPDGCPIAVVCMLVITWCTSAHLEASTGNQLQSYLDNWSLQSASPIGVVLATNAVADAVEGFAMTMSMDKFKFHASDASFRKILPDAR